MLVLISDLHLSPEQPHLTQLFEHFVHNIAPKCDGLYILGDFFEYWIGDDFQNEYSVHIEDLLRQLGKRQPVYFLHGNRDFLIGEAFASRTGIQLLTDPYKLIVNNKLFLLSHGDALCTDDHSYQEFRKMTRSPDWQQVFLQKAIEDRIAIAQSLREQSQMAQQNKTVEIMDVNPAAVIEFMQHENCDYLIHGHTHRPNIHETKLSQKTATRIVLADWREQGHYLSIDKNGKIENTYFGLDD